jgi:hypothetical protein
VGTNQVLVNWSGFSPTKIGRDGVDSSGGGAWDTGVLTGQPTVGSFTFNNLIPGDTYVLTATEPGGTLLHATVVMTGTPPVATPPVTTPPVTTPPVTSPPSTYASGLIIPASLAGFTKHGTDFKGGLDTSFWTTPYDGGSNPGGGRFMATHCKVINGVLTIEVYQDPNANDPGANNWAGGGIQTQTRYPIGTQFWSVVRKDTYPLWFMIQLLMGDTWPPEDDIEETTTATSNTESVHAGAANQQIQAQKSGLDLTDWGLWVHTWTLNGITTDLTVKGVTTRVATLPLVSADPNDPHSDVHPMFYSFQSQTESGTTPNDSNVTAANPIKFQLEQFAAFVPV